MGIESVTDRYEELPEKTPHEDSQTKTGVDISTFYEQSPVDDPTLSRPGTHERLAARDQLDAIFDNERQEEQEGGGWFSKVRKKITVLFAKKSRKSKRKAVSLFYQYQGRKGGQEKSTLPAVDLSVEELQRKVATANNPHSQMRWCEILSKHLDEEQQEDISQLTCADKLEQLAGSEKSPYAVGDVIIFDGRKETGEDSLKNSLIKRKVQSNRTHCGVITQLSPLTMIHATSSTGVVEQPVSTYIDDMKSGSVVVATGNARIVDHARSQIGTPYGGLTDFFWGRRNRSKSVTYCSKLILDALDADQSMTDPDDILRICQPVYTTSIG